jgi:hypothetical protein
MCFQHLVPPKNKGAEECALVSRVPQVDNPQLWARLYHGEKAFASTAETATIACLIFDMARAVDGRGLKLHRIVAAKSHSAYVGIINLVLPTNQTHQ